MTLLIPRSCLIWLYVPTAGVVLHFLTATLSSLPLSQLLGFVLRRWASRLLHPLLTTPLTSLMDKVVKIAAALMSLGHVVTRET